MVSTRLPATVAASVRQDSVGLSSISTVQAPHSPPSQPVLVPVRPDFLAQVVEQQDIVRRPHRLRSRPLSVNASSRAKRFFPSRREFESRIVLLQIRTHQRVHALQAYSREWLAPLPAAQRKLAKAGNDFRRYRDGGDLFRVVFAARRPDPGLAALDRERAADADRVLDLEAGTAEFATREAISMASPNLAGLRKLARASTSGMPMMPKVRARSCGLTPSAASNSSQVRVVEDLEEAAVEHDAGRIAVAPFDRHLPAEHERGHAFCLRSRMFGFIAGVCGGVNARCSPCVGVSVCAGRATPRHPAHAARSWPNAGARASPAAAPPARAANCRARPSANADRSRRSPSARARSALSENGRENSMSDFLPPGRQYSCA